MPKNDDLTTTTQTATTAELRKVRKQLHCLLEVMLVCVRRCAAYPLSSPEFDS